MKYLIFALALLAAAPAEAQSLLHPMFADHAVLQRDRPIPVYGQAMPGADVSVQLGGASMSVHADKTGQWRGTLPAMAAGGPYTLRAASGGGTQEIHDVLVGDVFLCTGQSNMQLSVRAAASATFEIAAAKDDQVRELAVDRVPSAMALTTFTSPVSWKVESPQTAGDF
jgi:sialate O-acetylesterase